MTTTTSDSPSTAPTAAPSVTSYTTDHRGRPFGAVVYGLDLPDGAKRVWRSDRGDTLVVREPHGLGPKGYVPVGYVAEGAVIPDYRDAFSELEIHYLARTYAAYPNAVRPPDAPRPTLTLGGECIQCYEPGGFPHSDTCPHRGKFVGQKVR